MANGRFAADDAHGEESHYGCLPPIGMGLRELVRVGPVGLVTYERG